MTDRRCGGVGRGWRIAMLGVGLCGWATWTGPLSAADSSDGAASHAAAEPAHASEGAGHGAASAAAPASSHASDDAHAAGATSAGQPAQAAGAAGHGGTGEHAAGASSPGPGSAAPADTATVGPGAVERLLGETGQESQPLDLYAAWNRQLAHPEPFRAGLAVLAGGTHAADLEEHGGSSSRPWLYLAGGVGLGALLMALIWRLMARKGSSPRTALPAGRTAVSARSSDIELVSSQVIDDQGSVLVVDVCGERLVLGVSGRRDFVTLLTRLGDRSAPPPSFDADSVGALLRPGSRSPAESSLTPRPAGSSAPPSAPAGTGAQDEDLEVLLDELLGKVRGLKPLAKRADET